MCAYVRTCVRAYICMYACRVCLGAGKSSIRKVCPDYSTIRPDYCTNTPRFSKPSRPSVHQHFPDTRDLFLTRSPLALAAVVAGEKQGVRREGQACHASSTGDSPGSVMRATRSPWPPSLDMQHQRHGKFVFQHRASQKTPITSS